MAVYYLQDCKLYVAEHDLSGDVNQTSLDHSVDELEVTTFGSGGARERIAGLETVSLNVSGFWDASSIDSALYDEIGGSSSVVTVGPTTGLAGETAYLFQALHFSYAPGGSVGDVYGFSATASGTGKLIQGTVMADASSAVSSSSTSTVRQLGAVSASQSVYAALHVIATTGSPTLDVTVKSDDGAGFGSPATQLTFTQATDVTSEWKQAAGAIADDYWRVDWTFGGSGTITFAVTVGIK